MAFSHRFDPTTLREYDIRGIVGRTLSEADAFAIGRCFGSLLARHAHELGPIDAAVIDDLIVITRAMVDDALQKELSQAAAQRRILRAVEGYLRWH